MFISRALRMGLVALILLIAPTITAHAQESSNGSTATAIEQVFIRTEPSTESTILGELQAGETVTLAGQESNGFASIYRGDYIGWVHMQWLDMATPTDYDPTAPLETPTEPAPQPTAVPTEAPQETPAPTAVPTQPPAETPAPAPSGSGLISWPVSGGEWSILQGYNGSSHQNNGSLWQYRDSIDLVRSDGSTAGQTVYSPANGTVRWLDPTTGGISIDMGNGYAVAMFHADFYGSVTEGDTLSQGQAIGTISPTGSMQANYGLAHLHIAVWATTDGGNWSRQSVPFEGQLAIDGLSLPNNGTGYQHTGLLITP